VLEPGTQNLTIKNQLGTDMEVVFKRREFTGKELFAEIVLKKEKSPYATNDVKGHISFSQLRIPKDNYLNCVRTWYPNLTTDNLLSVVVVEI